MSASSSDSARRSPAFARALCATLIRLWRLFVRERLSDVAASLAYSTLLTLVPLVALSLALAAWLPGFSALIAELENLLASTLLPEQSAALIVETVRSLAENAQSLAWPGLGMLFVVVILMLHTLETAMNRIWGVAVGRRWRRRIPLYLFGLLGVPLLMGALTNLTDFLINLALGWHATLSGVRRLAFSLASPLMMSSCFALFFYAMPNTRVGFRAALLGGLLAGFGLFVCKLGFRLYLASTGYYATIYGALAALPVFLFWLYLVWALILIAAALSAVVGARERGTDKKFP